jgi:NAD(P)-dependent dehydrogenase (short-subunit alcohol dehydrogenase family)
MALRQQPLASPFGARSTAAEVVQGVDLRHRTAIVTGASAGLGAETARALASAGAHVILAVRSVAKGEAVAAGIRAAMDRCAAGSGTVEVAGLDLSQWDSVRAFARGLLQRGAPIHLLVNNAGMMCAEKQLIEGRIEAQFGVNHLAHMLLTALLAPLLRAGAPARVVALSSAAHRRLPAYFDDARILDLPYEKLQAYSISKTASALFALELNRRLEAQGVTALSVNPGPVFTGIQAAFSPEDMKALKFHDSEGRPAAWFNPVEVGAATSVWCAVSPLLAGNGGVYCEDCNVATLRSADHDELNGVRAWAADPANARALWALSESLLASGPLL